MIVMNIIRHCCCGGGDGDGGERPDGSNDEDGA